MTKSIDPRYVLDEVEILGLLIERVAEHTGLLRFGESVHGVRLHTERSARHTAALFQELRDRRDTRARLAGQGPRVARSTVDATDPFEYMEQLLDTLRVLPTSSAMRLSPHIEVVVKKLALTPEQVEEHEPPPNPAKVTDSRFEKFREEHGDESWEVDALPPTVLRDIIEGELDELIDQDKMDEIKTQEEKDKKLLVKAVESLRKKGKG